MLGIPALVPSALAAYAVVGERVQGTLEPMLSTPIGREELVLGKALAVLVPSIAVSYVVYGVFLACVALFASTGVAAAFIRGPDILAQLLFTRSSPSGRSGSASRSRCERATSALHNSSRRSPASPRSLSRP